MVCAGCGTTNRARASFCIRCGAPLVRPAPRCPQCGVEPTPGARFCRVCGTHLEGGPTQPAASSSDERSRGTIGERFATLVVDPRTKRRTLAVAGVLGALLVLVIGFFGQERFPLLVALALIPPLVWVPLALWVDRHEPEPRWLLFVAFLWGASAASAVAYVVNSIGGDIATIGLGTEAADVYVLSISAPIVEETAKGAVLFFIFWRRRDALSWLLDAFVYATMVGLGFAMSENVLYFAKQEGIGGVLGNFVMRGVLTPLLHPLFTSMTAIGLVIALRSHERRVRIAAPLVGLLAAMGLHSLWNTTAGGHLGSAGVVFSGVFLLALVVVIFVVIGLSVRREANVIREYIPEEVVPSEEVDRLFRARTRIADAWAAFREGGWRAVRARDDYVRALSAAAFRNYREASAAAQLHASEDGATAGYRESLSRLLGWSAPANGTKATVAAEGEVVSATGRNSDELKVCPDCAEVVQVAARVCRYCGYRFELSADTVT